MPAYVVVEVEVHDPILYDEYKSLTPATIAAYDGRFVVRGAPTFALEGDWNPERLVILEFPTVDCAKEWWSSVEYSEAKDIRQRAASTRMLVVQGY